MDAARRAIQTHLGPAHHLRLARTLASLRERNVLVIGSFTHPAGGTPSVTRLHASATLVADAKGESSTL
ncbi:hypothetical protein [Tardiphaga sp. 813_E8_N1_3]|jgi:hypothetical protein|uniref:hypothetical protein n=1 Tax=Tardiphaga sp. 813_E8_N1_3 TaxID=3240760 RepID=UPI003F20B2AE